MSIETCNFDLRVKVQNQEKRISCIRRDPWRLSKLRLLSEKKIGVDIVGLLPNWMTRKGFAPVVKLVARRDFREKEVVGRQ